MLGTRDAAREAGLMSYGPNNAELFRRAGDYVDNILRGAKPGDIPVEQPTKFDLVVNLITAQALGIEFPPDAPQHRRRGDRIAVPLLQCVKSRLALCVSSLR
jgi:ABC-type uncharacterized transport system substrate-binding protein